MIWALILYALPTNWLQLKAKLLLISNVRVEIQHRLVISIIIKSTDMLNQDDMRKFD